MKSDRGAGTGNRPGARSEITSYHHEITTFSGRFGESGHAIPSVSAFGIFWLRQKKTLLGILGSYAVKVSEHGRTIIARPWVATS